MRRGGCLWDPPGSFCTILTGQTGSPTFPSVFDFGFRLTQEGDLPSCDAIRTFVAVRLPPIAIESSNPDAIDRRRNFDDLTVSRQAAKKWRGQGP